MAKNNMENTERSALDNAAKWPEGLIDITEHLVIREFTEDEAELCRKIFIKCGCMADRVPAEMTPEEFRAFHLSYIKYQYGFYGYGNWGIFLRKDPAAQNDSGEKQIADYSDTESLIKIRNASTVPIGLVGLINGSASQVGELSYYIIPEYRRKGFAYEASLAALEYGRECGFERFEARISPDNIPSLKLAEKLGIKRLG